MLRTGLDDLAENRTTKLMRAYHLTIDDLAAIREVICTLDPRPGSSFSQRKGTVYVIPDITIRRDGTAFSVQVPASCRKRWCSTEPTTAWRSAGGMDDEAREWLHEKRAEADAALANIDQRRRRSIGSACF